MDLSYQTPDYGSLAPAQASPSKKQKMKTVYPTLEIRGEGAIKFFKANPKLALDQKFEGATFKVVGMKKAEGSKTSSEYDNCITFEVLTMGGDDEGVMDDSEMPKD